MSTRGDDPQQWPNRPFTFRSASHLYDDGLGRAVRAARPGFLHPHHRVATDCALKVASNHRVNGEPLNRGQRADLVTRTVVGGPKGSKAALLILDQYSGQNPHCWPEMPAIARCAEVTTRQLRRALAYLSAKKVGQDACPACSGAETDPPPALCICRRGPLVTFEDGLRGIASRTYWIQYPILAELQARQQLQLQKHFNARGCARRTRPSIDGLSNASCASLISSLGSVPSRR